ncbi:MAG: TetR/AcrR family transcriptional regulator [Clostridiaceae bacterium]|nr:TetR/AcrR family transcriptional regulator [Clostridiaceae bacterium]
MDESNLNTRDRIILAALTVIGEQGTDHITTRIIAKNANVNHAAINYYFESKEDLIEKTLQYFQSGLQDIFEILHDLDLTARERLSRFSLEFVQYNSKYPGVEHYILSRLMTNSEIDGGVTELMKSNLNSIEAVLTEISGRAGEKALRFKALSFFSSLVYPLLLNRYALAVMGADYGDNQTTRDYINVLIDSLIQ